MACDAPVFSGAETRSPRHQASGNINMSESKEASKVLPLNSVRNRTVSLFGCHLVWEDDNDNNDVVDDVEYFMVVSQDKNGMFYHLGTTEQHHIRVPAPVFMKTKTFLVLAIGKDGVNDKHELQVTPVIL